MIGRIRSIILHMTLFAVLVSGFTGVIIGQGSDCDVLFEEGADFESYGIVTAGLANNIRIEPSVNGERVGKIPPLATVEILPGVECVDGYLWREITYNGIIGWTVETDGESRFLDTFVIPETRTVGILNDEGDMIMVDTAGASFSVPLSLFQEDEQEANIEVSMMMEVTDPSGQGVSRPIGTLYRLTPIAAPEMRISDGEDDSEVRMIIAIYPFEDMQAWRGSIPDLLNTLIEGQSLSATPDSATTGIITARGQYIEMANGIGYSNIRYIDQVGGPVSTNPAYAPMLYYTYYGVTLDEEFYVSVNVLVYPSASAIVPTDFNLFMTNPTYAENNLAEQTEALNRADPAAFTPSLLDIEAVIRSLTIRSWSF